MGKVKLKLKSNFKKKKKKFSSQRSNLIGSKSVLRAGSCIFCEFSFTENAFVFHIYIIYPLENATRFVSQHAVDIQTIKIKIQSLGLKLKRAIPVVLHLLTYLLLITFISHH